MSKNTVIIVDDDETINSLLVEIMNFSNYQVVGVGYNGNDAISLYKKYSPSLVLLDVRMPYKDGFDALSEIKQFDPKAIVIMVTGDANSSSLDRLYNLGANGVITKPFGVDKLIELIEHTKNSDKMVVN